MSSFSHHCKWGCKDLGVGITFSSDSGTLQLCLWCHWMSLIWSWPTWTCFSVAVVSLSRTWIPGPGKPVGIAISAFSLEGSATGLESVGPDQTWGRTGSLQNWSLVWAPALISLSSPANLVANTLQAWWDLALTNQSSRYWWFLKSLCMAINFTSFGITMNSKGAVDKPKGRALNWYVRPWMWNLRHFLDCSCIGIWT